MAIGKKPREATNAVTITGLNLDSVPSLIRSIILFIPVFFKSLKWLINTMPLRTATPNNAINPIAAEILKGIPLRCNAKTPPIADKGIAVNTNNACLKELNVTNNKKKINNNTNGKATDNLDFAFSKFSN